MDAFYERLILRAATIDELLSDAFEPLPGQKDASDLAARRLAAWCQASASGDWSLFARRLERDGWSIVQVLERLATVRRSATDAAPAWVSDAIWIDTTLQSAAKSSARPDVEAPPPFADLFRPIVEYADSSMWSDIDVRRRDNLTDTARAYLRRSLLRDVCDLCAPAIYERFSIMRKDDASAPLAMAPGRPLYDRFATEMKAGGFRRLFEDKPVLLRLIAVLTRQWINTTREFIERLGSDLALIRCDVLRSGAPSRVGKIEDGLSDPHNGGRSVKIVSFEDGSRVVYKPKDLRIDVAWRALVERLNAAAPPVDLKAVRAVARDGYGWTEFIEHTGCADEDGCERFFRRAGAWLALFHLFVAVDMHQENMIASGEYPVPVDLEMILQATAEEYKNRDPEGEAFDAAMEIIANSVMMVGLLPAYGRSIDNKVFTMGGMASDWTTRTTLTWNDVNSDRMRPAKTKEEGSTNPNLPHVGGRYARLGDHAGDFIAGFEDYARFLLRLTKGQKSVSFFDGFAGLPVRRIVRPTRFYYMLLQRLKNHRSMEDGAIWSAQADFIARLADWEKDSDPVWPLLRAERSALATLNVPHFVSPSDGNQIHDVVGASTTTTAQPGMDRAVARLRTFDESDIAWQVDVIRENTNANASRSSHEVRVALASAPPVAPTCDIFAAEADKIAAELLGYAVRRGSSAAWIGLDWLGDAEVFQLVCLGPELYNGVSGIAVFLAAHAAAAGAKASDELARAAVALLRRKLKDRNAPRMARSLGVGGAIGLGSIVYALTVMSKCLHDEELLTDALHASKLFTDELIAADKQLDVIGGSAGAILALLRLYRDTKSSEVLARAAKCGEHLLAQPRRGPEGRRIWIGQGFGVRGLNGMSHGAAGYAYALSALSAAAGREDFAQAASECIAFENSSYDADRRNWPDLRGDGEPHWLCQWCHGAPGIGLARLGMRKRGAAHEKLLAADVDRAVEGVEQGKATPVDTLCCGTLGGIEFLCEAANALRRDDLRRLAAQRLVTVLERASSAGDYRWNSGNRRFNLGLFRGLAGVGYTLLRQIDASLPNVLIWE